MNSVAVVPNLGVAAVYHYIGYILNCKSVYHSNIFHIFVVLKVITSFMGTRLGTL